MIAIKSISPSDFGVYPAHLQAREREGRQTPHGELLVLPRLRVLLQVDAAVSHLHRYALRGPRGLQGLGGGRRGGDDG